MAARADIITTYAEADNKHKVKILIRHYSSWDGILRVSTKNMIRDIMDETRCNRMAQYGDLGVRVQTSGCSDPTQTIGNNEMEIEKAVETCDFSGGILKDTDDAEGYELRACTIRRIRDDLETFNDQILWLDKKDRKILEDFLNEVKSVDDYAVEWELQYMSAYRRLERLRNVVVDATIGRMEKERR